MDIRPILSTLRRHKTAAALIVLEIALSCAIVCNALFLISERIDRMQRDTGQIEEEMLVIQVAGIAEDSNADALTEEDLADLRALPGVKAATITNQASYGDSSWSSGLGLQPNQANSTMQVSTYNGDQHYLAATGLELVAGRNFNAEEIIDFDVVNAPDGSVPSVIVSQAVAQQLFPGQSAIGKSVYVWGEEPTKIIGVVRTLVKPNDAPYGGEREHAVLIPVQMSYGGSSRYLLRVDPERRQETLEVAITTLEGNGPSRIVISEQTGLLTQIRANYYRMDRAMAWLLVTVIVALLVITALGIVGLASFWVAQRTRQIGVRRALGATRGQILRYFQTENFLLATIGIVLGMLGAYGINQLLMGAYELPRLPAIYLPIGAVALWLLGQIAVFGPARRAAMVPPAVATRSV